MPSLRKYFYNEKISRFTVPKVIADSHYKPHPVLSEYFHFQDTLYMSSQPRESGVYGRQMLGYCCFNRAARLQLLSPFFVSKDWPRAPSKIFTSFCEKFTSFYENFMSFYEK